VFPVAAFFPGGRTGPADRSRPPQVACYSGHRSGLLIGNMTVVRNGCRQLFTNLAA
jgi:hypothetical protein